MLTWFTDTPCYGAYELVGLSSGGLPSEIEAIDRVLCGAKSYCPHGGVRYNANVSSDGVYVDVQVRKVM